MNDGLMMAAHQPNFIPYLGIFDKMRLVGEDGVFIIRDDCQYVERDWHNRQKIRTNSSEGFSWLHVPVDKVMKPLSEIPIRHDKKINGKEDWTKFHQRMIEQFYGKAPYFGDFWPGLENIYSNPGDNLADLNIQIIRYLASAFGIEARMVRATSLSNDVFGQNASETLANMALTVGAQTYISGAGGRNYLDASAFENKVNLMFQDYTHPTYPQMQPGFQPYMGAIDALFIVGKLPRSGEVIGVD